MYLPRRIFINSILTVSPIPLRTVPSEEIATINQSSTLAAPCSREVITFSRRSPESHSSTVLILETKPCVLLIDIGRISKIEPVKKFSMPFLVEASFTRFAFEPVVLFIEPSVRNLNSGPRARVMEVLIGERTSSACFIVGAVVICLVVVVSTFKK